MSSPALASRRLFSEFKALSTDPPAGIVAGPVSEDDIFVWEALIEGPEGTPFEGGILCAELVFPKVRQFFSLSRATFGPFGHLVNFIENLVSYEQPLKGHLFCLSPCGHIVRGNVVDERGYAHQITSFIQV